MKLSGRGSTVGRITSGLGLILLGVVWIHIGGWVLTLPIGPLGFFAALMAFPAPAIATIAYGFKWLLVPAKKKPKVAKSVQPDSP